MDAVNRTLYIPLYGKAYVSRRGIILRDEKAEQIWAAEGFSLKRKAKSKWLAYYMGMRSAVFDQWLKAQMAAVEDAVVVHIGCGMDSRVERVGTLAHCWYDIDFPEVIRERRRYYTQTEAYHMLEADVRELDWLEGLPGGNAVVVMEGVSMYLQTEALTLLLKNLNAHFAQVHLLMDCYTTFAVKASKYKNPINNVGVTMVYGIDAPRSLEEHTGLKFVKEHEMTPEVLIEELKGAEKAIFRKAFGGGIAGKLYRLYEYGTS